MLTGPPLRLFRFVIGYIRTVIWIATLSYMFSCSYLFASSLKETPVQSAICVPSNGEKLSSNTKEITVKGYAYSGGGRGIVRVDVSIDGGKIWHLGEFLQPSNQTFNRNWAWTQWKASIPIPEEYLKTGGQLDICCKAIDSSYNVQPELIDPIWNLRGVLCNSWHHVNVTIDPLSEIGS